MTTSCSSGSPLSDTPFNTTTISPSSTANQTAFGVNDSNYSNANTGSSGRAGELTDLINWVRGVDNTSPSENPNAANGARPSLFGDLLHSRPVVVSYNTSASGCTDAGSLDKDIVAFSTANDGLLHATKGGTTATGAGTELWSFVPPELFGTFKRLRDNTPPIIFPAPVPAGSSNKPYLLDGNLTTYVKDANKDCKLSVGTGDIAYLFITARRGGRFVYALDILDPDNPKFLWKKSNADTGYGELGQTWSQLTPLVLGDGRVAVIFGAGYDPGAEDRPYSNGSYGAPPAALSMGRGVFVADAATGAVIKQFGASDGMTNSIPSDVAVLTDPNSGFALRAYVGDTGGNVWKIDLMDRTANPPNPVPTADTSKWTVTKLASLGDPADATRTGSHARKFFFPFNIVAINGGYALLGGSGDREKPFDTSVLNRFYMLKDSSEINTYPIRCEGDESSCDLFNATNSSAMPGNAKGWYITLRAGEKTVGSATTLAGTVFFPTNQPETSATNSCSAPNFGTARMYAVNYLNAAATILPNRSETLPGGGFPPSPVGIIVQLDQPPSPGTGSNSTTPKVFQTVCLGPHCLNPGALALERRNFIYWFKEALD